MTTQSDPNIPERPVPLSESGAGWRGTTLGEVSVKISDGTHSTVIDTEDGDYFLLSCKNIKDGNVVYGNNERRIDEKTLLFLRERTKLEKNDVLITSVGTIGEVAFVREDYPSYEFQRSVAILKADSNLVLPRFLFYSLYGRKRYLEQNAEGAVQQCLFLGRIKGLGILLPPIPEQRAIADMLSSFDAKIELLREQNETLEVTAQVIFQEWFGKYSVENPEELPDGWRVGKVSDCMEIIGGGTPKTTIEEYWNGDISWFSVVDCPSNSVFVLETEKHITKEGLENSSTKKLPIYTTIITARGTVGKLALTGVEMTMNQSCYGLRSNSNQHCYLFLLIQKVIEILKSRVHGAVFDTITRDTFTGIDILIPTTELINEFEVMVKTIFEKIYNNSLQIQSLSKTRDELLPRLMSGEVKVV